MRHHGFLPPADTPGLSKSETIILTMAHTGPSNHEIADELGIKYRTVEQTIKNARLKYRDEEQRKALGKLKYAPSITHRGAIR